MAILTPVYQTEFYTAVLEELARNVDVFNAGSNGTLLLGSEDYMGDYIKEAGYDRIANLITRRDVTVNTAVSDLNMALNEFIGVDIAHKVGPVFETYENFARRGRSIEEMARVIGQQFAGDFLARGLDLLVSAIVAAVGGVAALNDAGTNTATCNYKHLLTAQRLFGDQFKNVGAYLMNSESFFDLVEDGLDNYQIENVAGVQIVNGPLPGALGKPIIVADVPSLNYDSDAMGELKGRVLALTMGAGRVMEKAGRRIVIEENVTGLENLGIRYQAETNTAIALKGYAWDTAAGRNPTDAAISTTANWDLVVDAKLSAASMIEVEAAN
jgi:hypothetical protein